MHHLTTEVLRACNNDYLAIYRLALDNGDSPQEPPVIFLGDIHRNPAYGAKLLECHDVVEGVFGGELSSFTEIDLRLTNGKNWPTWEDKTERDNAFVKITTTLDQLDFATFMRELVHRGLTNSGTSTEHVKSFYRLFAKQLEQKMRAGLIQRWDTYSELSECYKQGLSPMNCIKRLTNHHLQNGKRLGVKLVVRTLKHMQKTHPELFLQLFPTSTDQNNLADIMIALELAETNKKRNNHMLNTIKKQTRAVAIIAGENHMYGAPGDLDPNQGILGTILKADSSTSKPLAKLQTDIAARREIAARVANQIPGELTGNPNIFFVGSREKHADITGAGYWTPVDDGEEAFDQPVCAAI